MAITTTNLIPVGAAPAWLERNGYARVTRGALHQAIDAGTLPAIITEPIPGTRRVLLIHPDDLRRYGERKKK